MQALEQFLGVGTTASRQVRERTRVEMGGVLFRVFDDETCDMYDAEEIESGLHFLMSLCPKHLVLSRARRVDIYVVPLFTDSKEFPDGSNTLTRRNINSGMCMTRDEQVTVYVFRREEARKVFFHEMLHALMVMQDTNDFPLRTSKVHRFLKRVTAAHPWLASFQHRILLKESTTEALACAMELAFRARLSEEVYEALRSRDSVHSKRVCDTFLEWGDAVQHPSGDDTHAIEYYLLKDLIYEWALDKVAQWRGGNYTQVRSK